MAFPIYIGAILRIPMQNCSYIYRNTSLISVKVWLLTTAHCRALARMGNVYYQQQQWKEAIKYFNKSLAEHRNSDVLKKKQNVSTVYQRLLHGR